MLGDLLTDELHDLAPAIAPTSGLLLHRGVYNRMISEFCGGNRVTVENQRRSLGASPFAKLRFECVAFLLRVGDELRMRQL